MKRILILGLLALSLSVQAGNERGNGGNAVVCRNVDGSIKSAELLDIYETRALFGLEYAPLVGSIDENYKTILEDIYGRVLPQTEFMIFHHIQNIFTMLPAGVGLEPINDSLQIIIPRDCKIEQVANFYNISKIFIVSDIYNKFSDLDKLGLLLHEAFYYLDRQGDITNSRYVRRVVGHLLSKDFKADAIVPGVDVENDLYCTTLIKNRPNGYSPLETSFWAINLGNNGWRFEFARLNGHRIFSRKSTVISFSEGSFPLVQGEETTFQGTHHHTTSLVSKIDDLEGISIMLSKGVINTPFGDTFMALRWNGFDPDDKIVSGYFTCSKRNQ